VAAAGATTPVSTRVTRATEPDGTKASISTRGRVIDSPGRKAMKLSTLASAERTCSGRLRYLMRPVAARAVPDRRARTDRRRDERAALKAARL
jgi:hypothetical protein